MRELEEIKKEVSKKRLPEPIASQPLPHEIIDLEKMIEETPKIAPLFVKVERYREILENIHDMRKTIKNLKNLLALRIEISNIHSHSDEVFGRSLEKFADSVNHLSMEFALPRGMRPVMREGKEETDESVLNLQDEIAKLKTDLKKIKF